MCEFKSSKRLCYLCILSLSLSLSPLSLSLSAGVGRTGTFCTIMTQMKRIADVGTIDIFNFVQSMRHRRCFMVQTEVRERERSRKISS